MAEAPGWLHAALGNRHRVVKLSRRTGATRWALILIVVVVLVVIGLVACALWNYWHPDVPDPPKPDGEDGQVFDPSTVASVELIPDKVAVHVVDPSRAVVFALEAVLRDSVGRRVPSQPGGDEQLGALYASSADSRLTLSWDGSRSLRVEARVGGQEVANGTVPSTARFDAEIVLEYLDGKAKPAVATISVVPDLGTSMDVVQAPHMDGDGPSTAIVDGQSGTKLDCVNDSTFSFVGSGLLGKDIQDLCETNDWGGVAVFSGSLAMGLVDRTNDQWSQGQDRVNVGQDTIVTVPVVVWLALEDVPDDSVQGAKAQAFEDLELANAILASSRGGIQVDLDRTTFKTVAVPAEIALLAKMLCAELSQPMSSRAPDTLNVYYTMGDVYRGLHCPLSRPDDVVLVSWNSYVPSTVAHEFGHALGLDHYTVYVENLMHDRVDTTLPLRRHHLTIGQAFRMSATPKSLVNVLNLRHGQPTRICAEAHGYPCPDLALDLRR